MIIPVHSRLSDASNPYPSLARLGNILFLIEIQGRLEVEGKREGGLVGVLSIDEKDKVALQIGVHHLEGKIVSLPKPLGILTKQRLPQTEYAITEIVTKKIIFSKRPTPIVGHAGPTLNHPNPGK